jgi:hypothetical protein
MPIAKVMADKFQKEVGEAIKWLATEHHYFKELIGDLTGLKKDINNAKTKTDINWVEMKDSLRDYEYVGRAERRFQQHELKIEELARHARSNLNQQGVKIVDDLIKRIHIEAANLVRDASRYEGKIKELLKELDQKLKKSEMGSAKATLTNVEEVIADAEKWIAALVGDLSSAKESMKKYSFKNDLHSYFGKDYGWQDFGNEQTKTEVKAFFKFFGSVGWGDNLPGPGTEMKSGFYYFDITPFKEKIQGHFTQLRFRENFKDQERDYLVTVKYNKKSFDLKWSLKMRSKKFPTFKVFVTHIYENLKQCDTTNLGDDQVELRISKEFKGYLV